MGKSLRLNIGGHPFSFGDEAADDLRAEICGVISVPSFLVQGRAF